MGTYKYKKNVYEIARSINVRIIRAKDESDASRPSSMHLLNPTIREMLNALEIAERDMFRNIVIHTDKTWPRKQASHARGDIISKDGNVIEVCFKGDV